MRIVRGLMVAGLLASLAAPAAAGDDDGLVLRAVGWYQGKASISEDRINCEVPAVDTAISDGFFTMGIWNTFGEQTIQFPDRNSPSPIRAAASPSCGTA